MREVARMTLPIDQLLEQLNEDEAKAIFGSKNQYMVKAMLFALVGFTPLRHADLEMRGLYEEVKILSASTPTITIIAEVITSVLPYIFYRVLLSGDLAYYTRLYVNELAAESPMYLQSTQIVQNLPSARPGRRKRNKIHC